MNHENYLKILSQFMPSAEMQDYLAEQTLSDWDISRIIIGSPKPLVQKAKWLWGEYKDDVNAAVDELTLNSGEILYLLDAWYDDDIKDEKIIPNSPFLSFDKVLEHIQNEYANELKFCDEDEPDDTLSVWYVLEKWSPDGNGGFEHIYTYFMIGDEPIYFIKETENNSKTDLSYSYYCRDLYVPVPFNVGDMLYIDCSPFAPPLPALLIEKGDNKDCCCLQILYKDIGTKKYRTTPLKHGLRLEGLESAYEPMLSPLYQIKSIGDDFFSEDDKKEYGMLFKIRDFIGTDEGKGAALWNRMNGFGYEEYIFPPQISELFE